MCLLHGILNLRLKSRRPFVSASAQGLTTDLGHLEFKATDSEKKS